MKDPKSLSGIPGSPLEGKPSAHIDVALTYTHLWAACCCLIELQAQGDTQTLQVASDPV